MTAAPESGETTVRKANTATLPWCLALAAGFLWLAGCSSTPAPVLEPLLELETRAPVVLVPGVTGVSLKNLDSQKLVWGRGANFITPHDRGYGIIRSVLPDAERRIEPGEVIEEIRLLGVFKKPVYGSLSTLFEANGYRQGDLDAPETGDSFFLFSYDWRGDNVEAAGLLAEKLEALRRSRGDDRLPVTLICQSNGAHICRYLAKYGGAPLAEAEAGRAGPPGELEIRGLIMVGTSNGGGLRILRELNRGRKYISLVGRTLSPEAFFTVESLYQDLPTYRTGLFVDETGQELDVDLFDAETWRTYQWSIFAEEPARRLARGTNPEIFGTEDDRMEFLRRMLDRSSRLQAVLKRDVGGLGPIRYSLVRSSSQPTPDRAVLVRSDGDWRTLFTGDKELAKQPALERLVSAPGDGHATVESQLWLSPEELELLDGEPFEAQGGHFEMILDPATHECLLDVVLEIERDHG